MDTFILATIPVLFLLKSMRIELNGLSNKKEPTTTLKDPFKTNTLGPQVTISLVLGTYERRR